ncbi:hypothetical protein ETAA8_27730 [Anatilimnocola aggregata]|uniref:Uncharacterized protein n=1 Tax=Anatilimnocola aggregata TaxID=2528021 RepID=A0A517YBT5_9BACT|nr:hypothetical protein [Anatilimnocola aggregata]QDU27684.1 hypothetical protein ETAA8_27730 [Anatilimnocola aggregata]
MASQQTLVVSQAAKEIYELRLRSILEQSHQDQYVAIEPYSGQHFIGETLTAAIQAARQAFPDRLSFALRVGHETTVHLGELST